MIDEIKLIDDLNKKAKEFNNECGRLLNKLEFQESYRYAGKTLGIVYAMKIVNAQEIIEVPFSRAENEWIPVSERMPEMHKVELEDGEYFMISDSVLITDGNSVCMSEYEINDENRYGWIEHDYDFLGEVIAWMPLPEPYKPETHEAKKQTNADRIRNMTDEEMADFLMDISMGMLFDKKIMNVKSWLQSEVEE